MAEFIKIIEFKFKLRRVMMYNHMLFAYCGRKKYQAIAEDSPDSKLGLLVWPDDFGLEPKFTKKLIADFQKWSTEQGIKYTICKGKRC